MLIYFNLFQKNFNSLYINLVVLLPIQILQLSINIQFYEHEKYSKNYSIFIKKSQVMMALNYQLILNQLTI